MQLQWVVISVDVICMSQVAVQILASLRVYFLKELYLSDYHPI